MSDLIRKIDILMNGVSMGRVSSVREIRDEVALLEATLRENTAQAALIINPPLIEQPSHEDFILWLSSYRDEFIAKSEHVELLEAHNEKLRSRLCPMCEGVGMIGAMTAEGGDAVDCPECSNIKMFLTSWPHGTLRPVEVIKEREDKKGYFYIRYLEGRRAGGTDTTTSDFLFDLPSPPITEKDNG